MKKLLLILLALCIGPVLAQDYTPGPYILPPPPPAETGNIVYTTVYPPPQGAEYNWSGFINFNTGGGGLSGGNVPAYNSQTGTFIFGYQQGTVTYNFFGNNEWPSSGILVDGFKYSWEYYNQDFSRGTLSANISLRDPSNNLLENYNFQLPQTTSGWTVFEGQIDFAGSYDRSEIGSLRVSFTGNDDRFWAGYYGPQVRDIDVSIMYSYSSPSIPDFLYWNKIVNEGELFTLTETSTVRYGANGVYLYQTFQPGTYACTNGDWGNDPLGGVYKSCEVGSNELPNTEVNCILTPEHPTCIVNSLANIAVVTPVQNTVTDENTNDGSTSIDNGSAVVDNQNDNDTVLDNTEDDIIEKPAELDASLDKTSLADEPAEKTTVEKAAETVVTVAAIADESKANDLADSISKNVLEGALSIANDATSAATSAASDSQSSSSSSSTRTAAATSTAVAAVQEITSSEIKVEENKVETTEASATALELLDTGRQLGSAALAATAAASEQSANESVAQAESIAANSSESQSTNTVSAETVTVASTEEISTVQVATVVEQNVDEVRTSQNQTTDAVVETLLDSTPVAMVDTVAETDNSTVNTEITTDSNDSEKTETVVVAETQDQIDSFAEMMNLEIKPVTEKDDADVEFIQQLAASSNTQTQQEENNSGFNEDEKVTIANDPALANAFNIVPSVANLEAAGVGAKKQEDKSDAEKRADEVVAANAKEQEEINKNYMDADQSGIVAAIGADTDVSTYRSAMIQDNNIWYRPEDIYKNIVYKDNVRGAYFLEKGNTDTYKKMVEEQYK